MSKSLRILLLVTDFFFILYWLVTLFHLIPEEYLYQDYQNELLVIWNWSFFPLDLLISVTGFICLYLFKINNEKWRAFALVSLTLTSCSGLQAIAFWTIKLDFDLMWWIPNLFLLLYPLYFIPKIITSKHQNAALQAKHNH